MQSLFLQHLEQQLDDMASNGLKKVERQIVSPQRSKVQIEGGDRPLINLCANNYLGLADSPELVSAAKSAMDKYGYGLASVRFICGTQTTHQTLEKDLAEYLEKDDAILFAACFDANGGLFEPLLGKDDAIVSDSLNHASIIDGIRLCKAQRYRFSNNDMGDLREQLVAARSKGARFIMIATDGVFSMDGTFAKLPEICALAREFDATVMVDDCHATGFIGPDGKGTPWHFGVEQDVDILTGTLGKALGGGMGGYIAGPQAVIDMLRQRARPYLFSNSLPPAIVGASIAALDLVKNADKSRARLIKNTENWRQGLTSLGFELLPGHHPIVPVMTHDAKIASKIQDALMQEGVLATAFSFPVVPNGKARVRTQMNASFSDEDISFALTAFEKAGKKTRLI